MRHRREAHARGKRYSGHDNEGTLRWLLTYADMITLLMAFFIMLYSVSVLNLNKFRQIALSIRSGHDGEMSGTGKTIMSKGGPNNFTIAPIPGDYHGVSRQAIEETQALVQKEHLDKTLSFRRDERGVVVSMVTDKALFAKGQADLTPESKRILDIVADLVKKVPNQVMVEGHTCDLPVASGRYLSNWELSAVRAAAVVRYLNQEKGIPANRLSAIGYADSKPLPKTGPDNREKNRRVDVVILKTADTQIKPEARGKKDGDIPK